MSWASQAINFLNQNSGAILALTTIIYALITSRMLYETKKMRQSQTEPDVFITVQPQEGARVILNLVIQNIGLGAAYDLRFKVEPDIKLRSGKNLSDINFMKHGFRYLAPKQKLECFIASSMEEAQKKENILREITVYYRNKNEKSYEATFVLDFMEYFGMMHVDADPFKGIVDKLETIHRDFDSVSKSSDSKLWVVAYTKQEYEEEVRKQLEEFEEMENRQKEKN
ncbi:MAG: hypothetical protein ABSG73_15155 [Candidatus Aminicenantales bacterium]